MEKELTDVGGFSYVKLYNEQVLTNPLVDFTYKPSQPDQKLIQEEQHIL